MSSDTTTARLLATLDVITPPSGWVDRAVTRYERTHAMDTNTDIVNPSHAVQSTEAASIAPSVDPGSAIDDSDELLDAIERSHPDYDRFMADALADALTGKRETVKPGQIGEWISKIAEAGKIVESNHGEE